MSKATVTAYSGYPAPELLQNSAALGNVRSVPVHADPVLLVGIYKVWYSVF